MTTDDSDRPGTPDPAVVLRAGDTRLTVRPDEGARISSLLIDGTELLRQGERFGSFVMAPWCGRTREGRFRNGALTHRLPVAEGQQHAMHGTVRGRPWRTLRAGERTATFSRAIGGDGPEGDAWPYAGLVTQTVELAEDGGGVTLTLGVETDGVSFPAQAGWHPWFSRRLTPEGPGVELDFTAGWQEERGADHLPTGQRIAPLPGPWDDCFGMPEGVAVTLTWPGQLELKVTSRTEWVVIYDEVAEAVCVEPQSGPPDGLNTTPHLVTPIEPLEISTVWTWRRLP
ncbi:MULTISPECIES: aldose epimerase family protein [Streptomyces]|uniref:Aldose 1-epimerase n=2 Tax=Streptomyces TaxID=1883 RepID=A0A1I6SRE0_9ACTN|nr:MULTISPECIES: aldose epimerase [Streptomyces]QKV69939.1 aldose 1-epimerase [Streptomyces harbinensis]SFS79483.1 aldose 1-epimerase [Streptomyces harbinensis]